MIVGMVYIDPYELGWRPYMMTWIEAIDENVLTHGLKDFLRDLFDAYVEDGLRFVRKHCKEMMVQDRRWKTRFKIFGIFCVFFSKYLVSFFLNFSVRKYFKNCVKIKKWNFSNVI